MRCFVIPWLLISLAACGSTAMLTKRLPLLNGQPAEEAVKAFGPAYQNLPTTTGAQYRWIRRASAQSVAVPIAGFIHSVNVGGTECILIVDIDQSGRIVDSNYEGHDSMCASFDLSMRNYIKAKA